MFLKPNLLIWVLINIHHAQYFVLHGVQPLCCDATPPTVNDEYRQPGSRESLSVNKIVLPSYKA